MPDLNCLSYWYPILKSTGVPTPETRIIKTDIELFKMSVTGHVPKNFDLFLFEMIKHGNELGYPLFMRTGHFSGKHYWRKTCFLEKRFDFTAHIRELVEASECVDIMGIPYNVWVLRKMLKTAPAFTAFDGFPVVKERRYFVQDGNVACSHPYWPADCVVNPSVKNWKELLREQNYQSLGEIRELTELSERVARAFQGSWSIDWLQDAEGKWWCTDMATAADSYHWEDCPNRGKFNVKAG